MLVEIRCDKFRNGTIHFETSLNVVLGDSNATNSIGKSSMLMVIDFAFGGDDLISHNTDLIREVGHHDYFFTFLFDNEMYRFRRGTYQASVVYLCDDNFEAQSAIAVDDYTARLKALYSINLPDLTFRALVGLYTRVWGKDNLKVERPLHIVQQKAARECVDNLIKTFNQYGTIRDAAEALANSQSKLTALKRAKREDVVPTITKREYANNRKRIAALEDELGEIRNNLAKYATNLSEIVNREILQLKLEKDRLLAMRLTIGGRLQRIQRNLHDARVVQSRSFRELTKFFPEINQDRLAKVEEFHSGVARLLRAELKESERQLQQDTERIDAALQEIDDKMAKTLSSVEEPSKLVDHVLGVAVELEGAKEANTRFDMETALVARVKDLRAALVDEREKVLATVQAIVNDGMRRVVTSAFGEDRKSPQLTLEENNYRFEVYEDTGTGTAYAGLVVFDLTVFLNTPLPIIAHDTVLFKNIENDSVAALLRVYMQSTKQSFVALDEIEKYGAETAEFLRKRSFVQLDDNHLLYVKDWRTKAGSQQAVRPE